MKKSKHLPRSAQHSDILIGERIRARRNQIKMSQAEFGKALGVSFQQVQKYEKGQNRLSSGKLIQAAQALECSVNDLLGGAADKGALKPTPASKFAASREGVALIEAMAKIKVANVRREIISLAERLAATLG